MPAGPVSPRGGRLLIVLFVLLAAALIITLRTPGLLIVGILATIWLVWLRREPEDLSGEYRALVNSVRLSADEIQGIIDAYHEFLHAEDVDNVADRTLKRPALANPDSQEPAIEQFIYQEQAAERFLNRLSARLQKPAGSTTELETLLAVTDRRAAELAESWVAARRAAYRLGGRG